MSTWNVIDPVSVEWTEAQASWFYHEGAWRLMFGTPSPNVPNVDGKNLAVTMELSDLPNSQVSPNYCQYDSRWQNAECRGSWGLISKTSDQLISRSGAVYETRDLVRTIWDMVPTHPEDIGNWYWTSDNYVAPKPETEVIFKNEDGDWVSRGYFRQDGGSQTQIWIQTASNISDGGYGEYTKYSWGCTPTKEQLEAAYPEDSEG